MNLRINRKLLKRNENTQMRSDVQGEVWSSTLDLVSATRVPAVQTGQIYTNLTCAELLTTQWPGDSNAMKSEQFSTTEFDPLSLTCLPVPGLPVPGTGMSMFVWNVCGCGCGCGCVIIFASSWITHFTQLEKNSHIVRFYGYTLRSKLTSTMTGFTFTLFLAFKGQF